MSTNRNFTNGDDSFVLFEKGTAANIPSSPNNTNSIYTDGKIYLDTDNSKLYIDADRKQGTAMVQKRHLIAGNSIVSISDTDSNGNATITKLDGTSGSANLGKTYTAGNGITINSSNQISALKSDQTGNQLSIRTGTNPGLYVQQANADKTDTSNKGKVWKTDPSTGVPGWRDDSNTVYTAGTGISISNGQISCTVSDTDTWKRNTKDQEGYVIAPKDTDNNYLTNKVWKTNSSGTPGWRDVSNIIGTGAPTANDLGLLIPTPTGTSKEKKYKILNALGQWVGINDSDTITSRTFYDHLTITRRDGNGNVIDTGKIYTTQLTVRYPGELVVSNYGESNQVNPQLSYIEFHINPYEPSDGSDEQKSILPYIVHNNILFWKCVLARHFTNIGGIVGGGWSVWTNQEDARSTHTRPLDVSFRYDSNAGRPEGSTDININTVYCDIYLDQSNTPYDPTTAQTPLPIIDIAFIVIGTYKGTF